MSVHRLRFLVSYEATFLAQEGYVDASYWKPSVNVGSLRPQNHLPLVLFLSPKDTLKLFQFFVTRFSPSFYDAHGSTWKK